MFGQGALGEVGFRKADFKKYCLPAASKDRFLKATLFGLAHSSHHPQAVHSETDMLIACQHAQRLRGKSV